MDAFPTELLSRIFTECLPNVDEPYPPVSKLKPPLLFTTINRRWRQVSCESPELWTRIHIKINVTADLLHAARPTNKWKGLQNVGEAISRWFERSAGRDVCVSFEIVNIGLGGVSFFLRNKTFDELILPMLHSICTYSKQWRHLKLEDLHEPYRSSILSIPAENLPRLSQLSFRDGDATVYPLTSFNSFITLKDSGVIRAPVLCSLRLEDLSPLDRLQDLPLANWANLRELHFSCGYNAYDAFNRYLDMGAAEDLLRRCKNLNVLKLTIQEGGLPLAHPSQDIALPRLASFDLQECAHDPQGRPFLTTFLSLLKLPALTHLAASAGVQPGFGQEASLMTLIKANEFTFRNTLTDIEFEYNYVNQDELRDCFKLLPAVRRLKMTASSMYPYREMESISYSHPPHFAMFWGLTDLLPEPVESENANGGIECPLPNLEHFHVRLQRQEEFEADELVQFVEARLKYAGMRNHISGEPIAKLKYAYVGFVSEQKIDVHEGLGKRGVNLDGVEVTVEYELECQCASI